MAQKERFGTFVLLEELGSSSLGSEHRAAKLATGGGLERLVRLIRLAPALSANQAFTDALLEQAKAASLLHGPNILKLLAIGRVKSVCYLAYEHAEGNSLRSVMERSRRDAFPLTPDHALIIVSRVSAALDHAQGRPGQLGGPVHGLLTPDAVVVTHDGEVKLRGFGLWAAGAVEAGAVAATDYRYLAPEQLASRAADAQSDVFGAGALLFEMLTGQPLAEGDPGTGVKQDRLAGGVEGEALPEAMAEILSRALAKEPAQRFADMAEMRQAIDAVLYSGEFNPTTFNLAFFMHSLFRKEIEREARSLAEDRAASYAQYWVDDAPREPASKDVES